MYTLIKKYGVFLVGIITILVFLSGCRDELAITDFQVDSETYQQEGYFIGNDKVEFNVELAVDDDEYNYHWTANGGRFLSQGESSVEYITPRAPGDYNIRLIIKDNNDNELTYNFSFLVKGNYPEVVDLVKANNTTFDEGVDLEWTAALEDDFYSYQILRSNNLYIDDSAEVIKEIYDSEEISYTDYDIEPNERYSYQIMVTNNDGYLSVSNEELVDILAPGIQEIEIAYNLSDLIVDNQREQAYILKNQYNKLLVLDLNTLEIIAEKELNSGARDLLLTEDKKYLFIINEGDNTISRVELDSLSYENFDFALETLDLSLDEQYLYLLTEEQENNIKKIDVETMELEKEYSIESALFTSFRKLEVFAGRYVLLDEIFGDSIIYDLEEEVVIDSYFTGPIKKATIFSIEDGYKIFLANRNFAHIKVFNFNQSSRSFEKEGIIDTREYPDDFVINEAEDLILATYDRREIAVFSNDDYRLLDTINLRNYAYDIDLFFANNQVYTLTSNLSRSKANLTIIDLARYLSYSSGG